MKKHNISIIIYTFLFVAITSFAAQLFLNNQNPTPNSGDISDLINISELSDEFMDDYFSGVEKISQDYDNDNILLVVSKNGIKDKHGATTVVEAPNNTFILGYDNELDKIKAKKDFDNEDYISVTENQEYGLFENEASSDSQQYNSWGITETGLDHMQEIIEDYDDAKAVTVAIIDTGCDMDLFNKYFSGKIGETYNLYTNAIYDHNAMFDSVGHGTHIAGTIAEGTPSNVKILPIKISDDQNVDSLNVITAINYITHYHKANVINMSFGGHVDLSDPSSTPEYIAIKAAKTQGIISVAAAGNESNTADNAYPAAFDNTISISAIDYNQEFASSFSNYGDTITFAAPGVDIKSIMSEDTLISQEKRAKNGYDGDDDHETISGTSMATPHAVSIIAALKSIDSDISFEDTITLLKDHAVDFGAKGHDKFYGYGLISLKDAVICQDTTNSNCDEFGIFKNNAIDMIGEVNVVLTPYNYGSLTNILATTVSITDTNGNVVTKQLGDFDIDEISIEGYNPYDLETQNVRVEYAGFELNFEVTNPADYESGWEYFFDGYTATIQKYKNHNLGIKTLYIPSTIDDHPVARTSDQIFGDFNESDQSYSFVDILNYTTLVLPENLTRLGYFGYGGFSRLEKVISKADKLIVGFGAFAGLKNLHTIDANILFDSYDYVDMDGTQQHYEASGVFHDDIMLKQVSLSEENTSIPDQSFYHCVSLDSIEIPNTVVKIGKYAFSRSGVKQITGVDNLASIGTSAFSDSPLESFYIGPSLTEIGEGIFANAQYLASLTVSGENPKYDSRNNSNSIIETAEDKLIVGIYTTIIPNTVKTIASNAFFMIQNLYEIEIPEGVTTIEDNAFFDCYLWKVKMPRSLQSVGEHAFQGSGNFIMPTVQWVYPDSYALLAAIEHRHSYVIIGGDDPAPIGEVLVTFPKNEEANANTFEAFQTINSENTVILISYYNEDGSLSEPVEITEYTVEYQDGLDSLRATSDENIFRSVLTFNDYEGYHGLQFPVALQVNKATPTYQIPENLTASPGQTLSSIALPEGFSWMDENETVDYNHATYNAKYTPKDTDNYKIIENIPIPVAVGAPFVNFDESLTVKDNNIIVSIEDNFSSITEKIQTNPEDNSFTHLDKNGDTINSDIIKTGDQIKIVVGTYEQEYSLIVRGDTDGNGEISEADYRNIQKDIMNMEKLSGIYKEAADMNNNNKIDIIDYIRVKKIIMGARS